MTKNNNLRNNYLLSLGEILSRIPMIFTIGYLAKSVGPEAFGAWSLILVVQTLMTSIGAAGFASALIRFGPNAEKNIAYEYIILSIKRSAIFLGIISLLVYFFHDNIGAFLNINPEYRWLLMATSIMTIGTIVDGHLDKYFKESFKRFSLKLIKFLTIFVDITLTRTGLFALNIPLQIT